MADGRDEESGAGAGLPDEPELVRELEAIPYEPLLPAERKLIVGSLLLGVLLLGVLLWLSTAFFPASPAGGRESGLAAPPQAR